MSISEADPSRPGLLWEYIHKEGEPDETLDMARRTACLVAESEARKHGKPARRGHRLDPQGYCVYWPSLEQNLDLTITPLYEIDAAGNLTRLECHRL